ncbi:MAG TPA: DUF2085 domain-containing protein [Chloroflexota bacterium]|nr:DUF2085 domain-containing protein [Chloroflexota bacterium]
MAGYTAGRREPPVWLQRTIQLIVDHWLLAFNAGVAVFATLPLLAPVLLATGFTQLANVIYAAYSLTCHQMASRAWHVMGHQMAYCERNTAIYFAMFLAGLAYARWRHTQPLDLRLFLLFILPMAIDGFTQLFGWRESTWYLRTLTGSLFGIATIWLIYPLLDRNMADLADEMTAGPSGMHSRRQALGGPD